MFNMSSKQFILPGLFTQFLICFKRFHELQVSVRHNFDQYKIHIKGFRKPIYNSTGHAQY